ncbi:MAG: putative sulfate exporter family transporter [Methyloceanibacter sp.]|uniref:putative sulfate exporter family transporter n=1 Tax=Methyloceanibacter sp. TaxID=1965321 RepID=UPI003D6CA63B
MVRRVEALSEDWLAVILGLVIFVLSLGPILGVDLLGFAAAPKSWIDLAKAVQPAGEVYAALGGFVALLLTYAFVLVLLLFAAAALGVNVGRFAASFTVIFWLAYACWVIGNYAYIAVTTPADMEKFGIAWSLRLTGESGYLIALLAGLFIANALPGFARWLNEAARPELFIKTAIVILGGTLGIKAAEQLGLASSVMFRGLAAIVEAYLIYWAVVYWVARKWFVLSREWAAPLASGISICGVSAAIATAGAIRARPMVAVMVSSLVVVFAMVELLILPFLAAAFLSHEPMVAAAWMGLAVKTDGAAVASGAITEALIYADAAARGVVYEKGWMLGTTTTVKIFIDIFIGVWAFILAYIWTRHIEPRKEGDELRSREIWERFPKFVLGFVATFLIVFVIALTSEAAAKPLDAAMSEANVFRQIFFLLTFFTIGLLSDLRRLWQEGIGRLAAVYVVCLFGFVIWVGLAISWIFFNGVYPPTVSG